MGCMVEVVMHEDYFDAILEVLNRGYQNFKDTEKGTELYEEVLEAYKNAIEDLKNSTKLSDVWDGHDRTDQKETRINWPKL